MLGPRWPSSTSLLFPPHIFLLLPTWHHISVGYGVMLQINNTDVHSQPNYLWWLRLKGNFSFGEDCGNGHELPGVVVRIRRFFTRQLQLSCNTDDDTVATHSEVLHDLETKQTTGQEAMLCSHLRQFRIARPLPCQRRGDVCLLQKRQKHLGSSAHP